MRVLDQLKAARRAGAPLLVINTPDPASTIREIAEGVNGGAVKLQWDIIEGCQPVPQDDQDAFEESVLAGQQIDQDAVQGNPIGMVVEAKRLPSNTILFIHNASKFMDDSPSGTSFIQGVWNLRDAFKGNKRTLILLGSQVKVPSELTNDVVVIDEPLPDRDGISAIVSQVHEDADIGIDAESLQMAVDATQGLSAFQVEQTVAMSLTPSGVVLNELWERKRKLIEQTPGLTVWRGNESVSDLRGLDNVSEHLLRVAKGKRNIRAVIYLDEVDKSMAGSDGDTSGTSQDQLGVLLSHMQDKEQGGSMFLGPPGSGKSALAKSIGNEVGVPTVCLDLGALKGSLVGQSEARIREAMKVIDAISGGQALWIATCNRLQSIKPELRRRFTLGTFFFDLPSDTERAAIWDVYLAKYGISGTCPPDENWTGAEIKQCCNVAWEAGYTLEQAAQFVVPVAKSAAKEIEALRREADGRFLSASIPGVYRFRAANENPSRRRAVAV